MSSQRQRLSSSVPALALVLGCIAGTAPAQGQAIPVLKLDIKEIETLARSDSNDAELQFYLALAYWQRRKWQQTDSLLRLAVRLDPRFAEGYLALYYLPFSRRTSLFMEEQRGRVPQAWQPILEEAHGFYQRAFRTDPLVNQRVISVAFEIKEPSFSDYTSPEYEIYQRYYAWLVDLGLGRYGSAHDRLQRLAEREFDGVKQPEKVPDYILWYRGLAAAHSRQYDAAITDFQALLERTLKQQQRDEIVHVPLRDNEYRFMLAALHQVSGHADKAVPLYQEALEHDLGLVMAHTYLAGIYEAAGMTEEALVERRRAAEVSIDDPAAQFDYAVSLFNVEHAAEAEEPLRRAVALNPRYAPPRYLLGRVAEELGRKVEARDYYTQFIALAPQRLKDLTADAQRRLAALPTQ